MAPNTGGRKDPYDVLLVEQNLMGDNVNAHISSPATTKHQECTP